MPYRAKDVAAARTEFGHPDVCLFLTLAHYYQAGLGENELKETFACLARMCEIEAKDEYDRWVDQLPEG